jgi:hypothetical protein
MPCEKCGPPTCPLCGSVRERFHDRAAGGCYSSHNHPEPPESNVRTCSYCGGRLRWNGYGWVCRSCGRKQ